MPAKTIQLKGGRIIVSDKKFDHPADLWRQPLIVETDAEGRFHLPAETMPGMLVVCHEAGYAEIRRDRLEPNTKLKLQPWGQIDGRLLWGKDPGPNEKISLIVSRPGSDGHGRFGIMVVVVSRTSNPSRVLRPTTLPLGERSVKW